MSGQIAFTAVPSMSVSVSVPPHAGVGVGQRRLPKSSGKRPCEENGRHGKMSGPSGDPQSGICVMLIFGAIIAGAFYAVVVFLVGFVLGVFRVLMLVPRLGGT